MFYLDCLKLNLSCKGSQESASFEDKLLRDAITNLENDGFCQYVMENDTSPLVTTYEAVHLERGFLDRLPPSVLGCHAVAVLQCLRELLRDVRSQKANLDQQHERIASVGIVGLCSHEKNTFTPGFIWQIHANIMCNVKTCNNM